MGADMTAAVHQTRPPLRILDPDGPLAIRAPRVQDAPALVEAIEASVGALRGFMPFAHMAQTVDVQYTRLADVVANYWKGEDYHWNLADPREPGRILGCVGLHRRAMNRRSLEVGYWVRTGYEGRGLCTRAARMAVLLAIEYFGCQRVQCCYDINNRGSARVADKVGFVVEGELRGFGPAGDDAMRANGWDAADVIRMTALGPDDARSQPWYGPLRERLQVFDWLGRPTG